MAWKATSLRMPEELKALVDEQAARLGLTQAEYAREALLVYTAWHRALDAVEAGADVEDLRDPAVVARFLGR
jgi:predicted transcriptional regulator